MPTCTKAIIPVAGYGTRRLPITKSIEKSMLPLLNRPVVDYIVQDCAAAGITDIYFVVSGTAAQLRNYYERDMELEQMLAAKGKNEHIAAVTPPTGVTFHFIEQDLSDGRYGTLVPVWLCRDYIAKDELVMVAMGDDVTYVPDGVSDIERMIALGQPAILGVPVGDDQDMSSYAAIASTPEGVFTHIVEKPAPGTEPSRLMNVSKYILPGNFMDHATESIAAGPSSLGEYLITDPINTLVEQGTPLQVVRANGRYLDTGTVSAWVVANAWLLNLQRAKG